MVDGVMVEWWELVEEEVWAEGAQPGAGDAVVVVVVVEEVSIPFLPA